MLQSRRIFSAEAQRAGKVRIFRDKAKDEKTHCRGKKEKQPYWSGQTEKMRSGANG